ncbi:MaoC family dehydratase [Bordetella bronchiseptica]|uniref:MaoC family dehydratase n=1 Tax=Bordetella bronchiseptica TaxID=518 RepID=UPI00045AA2DC|nr:MaoC family dehydratase [Bordetella bronchiseptica]AOB25731.1 hypothetical protein BBB44_05330 [Bordetella bronchiseptica]AZW42993.1 hypothetical protein CWR61_05380 [Bordetella bronchiseptica]KCV62461.1 MaoC-like protein [Bordetella bronchiseptica 99-R-0433]
MNTASQRGQAAQLYGVDLRPGLASHGSPATITRNENLGFAALTGDSHPIHYDEAFAARTRHGRCVVHGLLLASLGAFGATPLSRRIEDAMVAFVDSQFSFLKPVFIGDTVTSHFEVAQVEHKPARNLSLLRFDMWLTNGAGDTVMQGKHTYLVRMQPDA